MLTQDNYIYAMDNWITGGDDPGIGYGVIELEETEDENEALQDFGEYEQN